MEQKKNDGSHGLTGKPPPLLDLLNDISRSIGILDARLGILEGRLEKLRQNVAYLETQQITKAIGGSVN